MHRGMMTLSRLMAYLGGLMLSLLVLLTCVSILGRQANGLLHGMIEAGILPGLARLGLDLGIGPVNGDFELIEVGVAFAIFAFLPLCQITSGHAAVDVFTDRLPEGTNRLLRAVWDLVFAAVLILITVQLYAGMMSKMRTGQTSFLLEFPIWWGYALSLVGAAVAALVGIYCAYARYRELRTGEAILETGGAEH